MMAMAFAAGTAAGCLAGMVTVGLLSANKLNDAIQKDTLQAGNQCSILKDKRIKIREKEEKMDDLIKELGIDINEDTIAPDEEPDSEYDLSELLEDEDDEKE